MGGEGALSAIRIGSSKITPVIAFFRVVQLFAEGVLGTVHGA